MNIASNCRGVFVGNLSGYDYNEQLHFYDCTSNIDGSSFSLLYHSDNQSTFLPAVSSQYNGFLGSETYMRGSIYFDGNRFIPKWDGKTSVVPLTANKAYDDIATGGSKYVIYSAFDLAGLRVKTASPSYVYFKNDVDMNGQGKDGLYYVSNEFAKSKYKSSDDNVFTPFDTIKNLDGLSHTIYNLSICKEKSSAGAFILRSSGTTVHKNISFVNCQTLVTHDVNANNVTATGAILIATAGGTQYTMDTVQAINCRVFAMQKVGILGGSVQSTKSSLVNNRVNGGYVENYKCSVSEVFDSGNISILGKIIRAKVTMNPYGEVGGMFGFVSKTSSISNCHIQNTSIYGFGQNDKEASLTGSTLAKLAVKLAGFYVVPGRHVGTFIGDIRTAGGNITITNCTVDNNTKCLNRNDTHNSKIKIIGSIYYVNFKEKPGSVTYNGSYVPLFNCNQYTSL